jgi:N-methylhydantoinase A
VNAGLVPHISFYFERLTTALHALSITHAMQVMKSDGGLMPVDLVTERPVEIIESGPAAGVVGSAELARRLGLPRVLCFDMGGTTAKAGLLIDGAPILSPSFEVGEQAVARVEMSRGSGYPIKAPVIDLVEVGAGGGSIAWTDSGGILRVGPRSAGANPGPAGYGLGATEPTVTDANIVLGRIDPNYFLGGAIVLNHDAAWDVIETKLARPLGMTVPAAALGVLEVANATMLGALRMVSVQRGFDPREFTIICFGGAAGLQVDALMSRLGVAKALVPPSAGVGTARGMLFADVRREFRTTHLTRLNAEGAQTLQRIMATLAATARAAFASIAASQPLVLEHAADLRFLGQSHQFRIPLPSTTLDSADIASLGAAFRAAHTRQYGFAPESDPIELVELIVTAISRLPRPKMAILGPGTASGDQARKGTRPVWFDPSAPTQTAVYARHLLGAGDTIAGPAIVEATDSTILIGIDSRAVVDELGNVLISRN